MTRTIAIMGTGRIAGKVTPYIQQAAGCDVVTAASRDASRARAFADEHGIAGACTYDELLTRDDIDAVYITLPNDAHPVWSEKLLKAGKHVLCEKPLCWTKAQAERLFAVAREHNRALVEAFMYLHSPLTEKAAELARTAMTDPASSPIGGLERIEGRFVISIEDGHTDKPNGNIRYSRELIGGALMDLGCYPLSFARTVTGESPASLSGSATMVDKYAHSPRDGSDAVDGAGTFEGVFPSGVTLGVEYSMIEPPAEQGGKAPEVVALLIGDKGTAEIRDFPRPDRIVIRSDAGGERKGAETVIDSPLDDSGKVYTLQAESFAEVARAVEQGEACASLPSPVWSITQAAEIERALDVIGLTYGEPA